MKISKPTIAALRKRRQALLRQLPPLKAVLRGSLIERYKRCGKPGCKCADGPGHGPKYYLSVSYPGRRPRPGRAVAIQSPGERFFLANRRLPEPESGTHDSHVWLCHPDLVARGLVLLAGVVSLAKEIHDVENVRRDTVAVFVTVAGSVRDCAMSSWEWFTNSGRMDHP